VLFDEGGLAEGAKGGVYVRRLEAPAAVRLGDGRALALSPGGTAVITQQASAPDQLRILPTGPGEPRTIRGDGLTFLQASWFPDESRLLVAAREQGHSPSLYVQSLTGGHPRRIVDDVVNGAVSPDGSTIASVGSAGSMMLTPVDGGAPRTIRGLPARATVLRWDQSGRYVFVRSSQTFPVQIVRVEAKTGRSAAWRTLGPADLSGARDSNGSVALSADGQSYCYSYVRFLSTLFVVEGLK
jgi:hypothetical protein